MFYIDRIEIKDFMHTGTLLNCDFYNDVNIFVGRNATGKTTLMKIIAYTLQCKFKELCTLPFSEIILILKSDDKRNKPIFKIKKYAFNFIEVVFKEKSKGPTIKRMVSDSIEDQFSMFEHDAMLERMSDFDRRTVRVNSKKIKIVGNVREMDSLTNVSWLNNTAKNLFFRRRLPKKRKSAFGAVFLKNLGNGESRKKMQLDGER
ncbi:MAG: AAA family ATPase [Proteobacteria bacterium]|nr:AAA family ATPase [Pseudomonadota bacterium]